MEQDHITDALSAIRAQLLCGNVGSGGADDRTLRGPSGASGPDDARTSCGSWLVQAITALTFTGWCSARRPMLHAFALGLNFVLCVWVGETLQGNMENHWTDIGELAGWAVCSIGVNIVICSLARAVPAVWDKRTEQRIAGVACLLAVILSVVAGMMVKADQPEKEEEEQKSFRGRFMLFGGGVVSGALWGWMSNPPPRVPVNACLAEVVDLEAQSPPGADQDNEGKGEGAAAALDDSSDVPSVVALEDTKPEERNMRLR